MGLSSLAAVATRPGAFAADRADHGRCGIDGFARRTVVVVNSRGVGRGGNRAARGRSSTSHGAGTRRRDSFARPGVGIRHACLSRPDSGSRA